MTLRDRLRSHAGKLPFAFGWGRVLRSLIPTPGNVLFTTLLVGGLLAAHVVSASPAPSPAASGSSTGTIAYQGRLANASGNQVPDGPYAMSFSLYTASSGGSAVWGPELQSVTVANGLFNVQLGSFVNLPPSVFANNSSLWLGISVGTDSEMSQRVQLGSAPYAMQALTVPNQSITTNSLAANAVTQHVNGSVGASGACTSSPRWVDLQDASITLTTTGGAVLVWFTGSHDNESSPFAPIAAYWQIIRADSPTTSLAFNTQNFSTHDWNTISLFALDTPPAGTYTYKVQWGIIPANDSTVKLCASDGVYSQNFAGIELKR